MDESYDFSDCTDPNMNSWRYIVVVATVFFVACLGPHHASALCRVDNCVPDPNDTETCTKDIQTRANQMGIGYPSASRTQSASYPSYPGNNGVSCPWNGSDYVCSVPWKDYPSGSWYYRLYKNPWNGCVYWTHGSIRNKYLNYTGTLGIPVEDLSCSATGKCKQYFDWGLIGWRDPNYFGGDVNTNSKVVYGAIFSKYLVKGGESGSLGYPTSDETDVPGDMANPPVGRYNNFEYNNAAIYWKQYITGNTAYLVQGAIRTKWLNLGGPTSWVGWPITDETYAAYPYSEFQAWPGDTRTIVSGPSGQSIVYGAIRNKWLSLGRGIVAGAINWAYPITDELSVRNLSNVEIGRYNDFSYGRSIYWASATGAWSVQGDVRLKWLSLTGPGGWASPNTGPNSFLGFPVTDEWQPSGPFVSATDPIRMSYFQYGSIQWRYSDGTDAYGRSRAVDTHDQRLNEVRQKSAHNAFQKAENIIDMLKYHHVFSIELDIHIGDGRTDTSNGVTGDWHVYHNTTGSTCDTLRRCLKLLRAFHEANPQHEVVTLWIEPHDGWTTTNNHTAYYFDTLLNSELGSSNIYTTYSLKNSCPNVTSGGLKTVVTTSHCGWPLLNDLHGKFMIVLHTDNYQILFDYRTFGTGVAFTAPRTQSVRDITYHPDEIFFNMNYDNANAGLAWEVYHRGFISRVYGLGLDPGLDATQYNNVYSWHAHHLATNGISGFGGTRIINIYGYPFQTFAQTDTTTLNNYAWVVSDSRYNVPQTNVIQMTVNGPTSISKGAFLYKTTTNTNHNIYANVSSRSCCGGDYNNANGCLMARTGTDEKDAFMAVCRAADRWAPMVYYRKFYNETIRTSYLTDTNFCGSDSSDNACKNGYTYETPSYLWLRIYQYANNLTTSCVEAYSSADPYVNGYGYQRITTVCGFYGTLISNPLPLNYHGLWATSSNYRNIKFNFENVYYDGVLQFYGPNYFYDINMPLTSGSIGNGFYEQGGQDP